MEWAALIAWIVTAGGGFVLFAIWLKRGGMQQQAQGSKIHPAQILSHFLLAATGLVLWIIYVATDTSWLAWLSFAVLVVVALLGFTMFAIWLRRRSAAGGGEIDRPAEQHFPVSIVALHGLLGATTLVLVLLAAAGVGGS